MRKEEKIEIGAMRREDGDRRYHRKRRNDKGKIVTFNLVFTGPFICKWDTELTATVRVAGLKQPWVASNWCSTRKATSSS